MIKSVSIFFSLIVFTQSVNIHIEDYALRLYDIFEHYELHNERYGDNIIVFLSKHYGDLKESHKEQHQQEKKENAPVHQDSTSSHLTDLILKPNTLLASKKGIPSDIKPNHYYKGLISNFEKLKIFQPPKHA